MTKITTSAAELYLSVTENYFISDAKNQITYLLELAGIDTKAVVFSGHASDKGLLTKEMNDDEFALEPPDFASDDAFAIYFGDIESLSSDLEINNPIYYAKTASEDSGLKARVDVYDAAKIKNIPFELQAADHAWLTEDQAREFTIGVFVIGISK